MKTNELKPADPRQFSKLIVKLRTTRDFTNEIVEIFEFAFQPIITNRNTRYISILCKALKPLDSDLYNKLIDYLMKFNCLIVDKETGNVSFDNKKNMALNLEEFKIWMSENIKSYARGHKVRTPTENMSFVKKSYVGISDTQKQKTKKARLMLRSRRGKKINEMTYCSNCNTPQNPVWQYSDSNRGKVVICSRCKPSILNRSFGKKDAMDHAVLGGGFDSNKRKH